MQLALKCRIKGGNNSPARERVSPTTVAVARLGRAHARSGQRDQIAVGLAALLFVVLIVAGCATDLPLSH